MLKRNFKTKKMKAFSLIGFCAIVLCLTKGYAAEETLVDTFNDIYDTCLVHLNVDCVQPKAFDWLSKSLGKREIRITDDLTVLKNESVVASEPSAEGESARDSRVNLISKVDEFLATHYLNIRYPKAVISDNVPSFMVSTLNRFIPDNIQVPLEENQVNEGMFTYLLTFHFSLYFPKEKVFNYCFQFVCELV